MHHASATSIKHRLSVLCVILTGIVLAAGVAGTTIYAWQNPSSPLAEQLAYLWYGPQDNSVNLGANGSGLPFAGCTEQVVTQHYQRRVVTAQGQIEIDTGGTKTQCGVTISRWSNTQDLVAATSAAAPVDMRIVDVRLANLLTDTGGTFKPGLVPLITQVGPVPLWLAKYPPHHAQIHRVATPVTQASHVDDDKDRPPYPTQHPAPVKHMPTLGDKA